MNPKDVSLALEALVGRVADMRVCSRCKRALHQDWETVFFFFNASSMRSVRKEGARKTVPSSNFSAVRRDSDSACNVFLL